MRAALLAAVLVALLVAGCGGDQAAAQDTVTAAVSGLAKGDAKKVCDQLTAGARKKLLATLADNPLGFANIHARTCREGIVKLHAELPQPIRAVLTDGEVDDAKVTGDTATVHVVGAGTDAELRKVDGTWKITGLSGGLFRK
jgi:nitrous oxide reductase accessory protein NosL